MLYRKVGIAISSPPWLDQSLLIVLNSRQIIFCARVFRRGRFGEFS